MASEKPGKARADDTVDDLGEALARLYFVARRDYRTDLTHQAIRLLQFISFRAEPPRLDEVRAFLGCAPSTASEFVKRLRTKGLLTRTRSADDERAIAIELTDEGQKAVTEHTSLDPAKLRDGLTALDAKNQSALLAALQAMNARISKE